MTLDQQVAPEATGTHSIDVLVLACLNNAQAIGLLPLHDPLDALQLWVDEQRPAGAVAHNGTVVNRQWVRGQSLVGPLGLQVSRIEWNQGCFCWLNVPVDWQFPCAPGTQRESLSNSA
mgnify:CR=1 FL=1